MPDFRFVLENQQQRQNLDRLAETHVIRKAGPEPELREQIEPLHPSLLIGAERTPKRPTGIYTREPFGAA